jgi:hypothetical protein
MQIREILVEFKKGVKAVKHTKKNADPAKQFAKAKEKLEPVKPMEESGLQYYTGVKKHGAKYMKLAAKAGREGASQAELGSLKDKYSKAYKEEGVAEGLGDTRTEIISEYNDWKFVVEIQEEDDRYVRFFSAINPSGKEYSLPKGTSVAEFRQFVRSKSVAEAYDPWDEADVWYRYDSSEGKLKKRSFYHAQERDARANGWSDSLEQALRRADIIRSKFNPNQFVQKVGDKWVKVYPFGQPDGIKETASPGATSAGMVATLGMNPKLSPGPARGKKSYIGSPGKSGTKAPPQPKVKQPKSKYGTAKNALDMKSNIFGGGAIKRK